MWHSLSVTAVLQDECNDFSRKNICKEREEFSSAVLFVTFQSADKDKYFLLTELFDFVPERPNQIRAKVSIRSSICLIFDEKVFEAVFVIPRQFLCS